MRATLRKVRVFLTFGIFSSDNPFYKGPIRRGASCGFLVEAASQNLVVPHSVSPSRTSMGARKWSRGTAGRPEPTRTAACCATRSRRVMPWIPTSNLQN